MGQAAKHRKRDISIDFIRALAILLVVIVHTAPFSVPESQIPFFHAAGSLGVPLFVMLTGYLMLDRPYETNYLHIFLKRNLLPMFVSLEAWNCIWCVIDRFSVSPPPNQ